MGEKSKKKTKSKSKDKGRRSRIPMERGVTVPLDKIIVTKLFNVRRALGDTTDLENAIRSENLINGLVLRRRGKRFELICGHRRHQSVTNLGWTEVEGCSIIPEDVPDADCLALTVSENSEDSRYNLTPEEKGKIFVRLHDKEKMSIKAIADRCGCSDQAVRMLIRVIKSDRKDVVRKFQKQEIKKDLAEYLTGLSDRMYERVGKKVKPGMTLTQVKEMVHEEASEDPTIGRVTRNPSKNPTLTTDRPMAWRSHRLIKDQMEEIAMDIHDLVRKVETYHKEGNEKKKVQSERQADRLLWAFAALAWTAGLISEINPAGAECRDLIDTAVKRIDEASRKGKKPKREKAEEEAAA